MTVLLNPIADFLKVFDNITYNSAINLSGIDTAGETLSKLEFYYNNQQFNVVTLTPTAIVVTTFREWKHTIGRDITSPTLTARFRDYHVFLKKKYDNNNNKLLILHDIILSYYSYRWSEYSVCQFKKLYTGYIF